MMGLSKKSFTVFVVFTRSKGNGFWRFFNRKPFGHCYALVPVYYPEPSLHADQYMTKVEFLSNGVEIETWFADAETCIANLPEAVDIVKFKVDAPLRKPIVMRGMLNCVTLTKAVCLIQNWKIVTPFHLYRFLRMNGGQSVKIRERK